MGASRFWLLCMWIPATYVNKLDQRPDSWLQTDRVLLVVAFGKCAGEWKCVFSFIIYFLPPSLYPSLTHFLCSSLPLSLPLSLCLTISVRQWKQKLTNFKDEILEKKYCALEGQENWGFEGRFEFLLWSFNSCLEEACCFIWWVLSSTTNSRDAVCTEPGPEWTLFFSFKSEACIYSTLYCQGNSL